MTAIAEKQKQRHAPADVVLPVRERLVQRGRPRLRARIVGERVARVVVPVPAERVRVRERRPVLRRHQAPIAARHNDLARRTRRGGGRARARTPAAAREAAGGAAVVRVMLDDAKVDGDDDNDDRDRECDGADDEESTAAGATGRGRVHGALLAEIRAAWGRGGLEELAGADGLLARVEVGGVGIVAVVVEAVEGGILWGEGRTGVEGADGGRVVFCGGGDAVVGALEGGARVGGLVCEGCTHEVGAGGKGGEVVVEVV